MPTATLTSKGQITVPLLKRLYAATNDELLGTVEDLLGAAQFHVERREAVQAAALLMRDLKNNKAGFPDMLIAQIAQFEGCSHTVRFDKDAVRSAGMVLLV